MKKVIAVFAAVVITAVSVLHAQDSTNVATKGVAIERVLPQKTLILFKVSDYSKYKDKFKETVLYRLFDYFCSQEFFDLIRSVKGDVKESFQDAEESFKKETGMSFKELSEIPDGEIAVAIANFSMAGGDFPQPKFEAVVHCGIKDMERFNKLFDKATEKAPELQFYKLGNDKIWFNEMDKNNSVYFTVTSDLGFLLTVGSKEYFEATLSALHGEKEVGSIIADDPNYKKVSQELDFAGSDYYSYIDLKKILTHKDISSQIPADGKAVMDGLGVTGIKAGGMSGRIDKGRTKESFYVYAPGEKMGLVKALANANTARGDGVLISNEGDIGAMIGGVQSIAIAAAIAIPSMVKAKEGAQVFNCTANLKMLYQSLMMYYTKNAVYPQSSGKEVWLDLGKELGLADKGEGTEKCYLCPLAKKHKHSGDYRGPKEGWSIPLPEGRKYLACDEPGNHPDGSIQALTGDGEVVTLKKGSEDYDKALEDTSK